MLFLLSKKIIIIIKPNFVNIVAMHLYIAWIIQSESPGLLHGLPNLTDTKESTYFGVFMENVIDHNYLTHPLGEGGG